MKSFDRTQAPVIGLLEEVELKIPRSVTLNNGATMRILDTPDIEPVCQVRIFLPGGKVSAPVNSVALLGASELREGTTGFSSSDIEETLEECGASLRANAYWHNRIVTLTGLRESFPKLLPILGSVIKEPLFPEDSVVKGRQRIMLEVEQQMSDTRYHANRVAMQMLLGTDNPYARKDTLDAIKSISRSDIEAFHYCNNYLSGSKIFVAGQVDGGLIDAISSEFGIADGNGSRAEKPAGSVAESPMASRTELFLMEHSRQSSVRMMAVMPSMTDPATERLRFSTALLGGYFGSRLMQRIREELGLTYGITAGLTPMPGFSIATIGCECDSENVDKVINEVFVQIDKLASEYPSEDEMFRLKQMTTGAYTSIMDSTFNQLSHYAWCELSGNRPEEFQTRYEIIRQMTGRDVSNAIGNYLANAPWQIAVAGNLTKCHL